MPDPEIFAALLAQEGAGVAAQYSHRFRLVFGLVGAFFAGGLAPWFWRGDFAHFLPGALIGLALMIAVLYAGHRWGRYDGWTGELKEKNADEDKSASRH